MATDGIVKVRCKPRGGTWEQITEGAWKNGQLTLHGVPGPLFSVIREDLRDGKEYGDWYSYESEHNYDWEITDES